MAAKPRPTPPMLGAAAGGVAGRTFPAARGPPKLQKTGSLKSNAINQMISMNQGEEKEADRMLSLTLALSLSLFVFFVVDLCVCLAKLFPVRDAEALALHFATTQVKSAFFPLAISYSLHFSFFENHIVSHFIFSLLLLKILFLNSEPLWLLLVNFYVFSASFPFLFALLGTCCQRMPRVCCVMWCWRCWRRSCPYVLWMHLLMTCP